MLDKSMHLRTGIILVLLLAMSLAVAAADEQTGIRPGQTAPDFTLKDLRGKSRSLTQLRKKGYVLLLFWSTHCHSCYAMIPQLKNVHQQFNGKGLTLAAIDVGYEDRSEVKAFASDNKLPYLVLNDDAQKEDIIAKYQLVATPTLILVAPDGLVKYNGHRIPELSRYVSVPG